MKTVARLLVYSGKTKAVEQAIASSMGDGVRDCGTYQIRAVTLPEGFLEMLATAEIVSSTAE